MYRICMFWIDVVRLKKIRSNTTIKFNSRQKNNIKSNLHLNETELYKICYVHQTNMSRSLSHHTIMGMSLLHASIVPFLIS